MSTITTAREFHSVTSPSPSPGCRTNDRPLKNPARDKTVQSNAMLMENKHALKNALRQAQHKFSRPSAIMQNRQTTTHHKPLTEPNCVVNNTWMIFRGKFWSLDYAIVIVSTIILYYMAEVYTVERNWFPLIGIHYRDSLVTISPIVVRFHLRIVNITQTFLRFFLRRLLLLFRLPEDHAQHNYSNNNKLPSIR